MSALIFRKAAPADVPSLLKLVRAAYRGEASHGWTTEAYLVADDRIDESELLKKINAPNGQVLLALSPADELLACCEVLRHPEPSKSAYLGLFSVSPSLQNGGIGRKVLAEAERYARDEMHAGTMEMQVLWMRTELIAYYERRGYRVAEGVKIPFPYAHLVNPRPGVRQDLYFVAMKKALS